MKYIIYSTDKNICNFYAYDSDLQENYGAIPNKILYNSKHDDRKKLSQCNSFYVDKDKQNIKNGCIKSVNIDQIDKYLNNDEYIKIQLPKEENKYMICIPHNSRTIYALSVKFNHKQIFDETNTRHDLGACSLSIKCQYFTWIALQKFNTKEFDANKLFNDHFCIIKLEKNINQSIDENVSLETNMTIKA